MKCVFSLRELDTFWSIPGESSDESDLLVVDVRSQSTFMKSQVSRAVGGFGAIPRVDDVRGQNTFSRFRGYSRFQDEDPREVVTELCKAFYQLGWVTGTGGGVSVKKG